MMRGATIGLVAFIATALMWQFWINAGGEARKHWFFCDALEWCER